jgi:hypothetical protein
MEEDRASSENWQNGTIVADVFQTFLIDLILPTSLRYKTFFFICSV